MQKEAVIQHTTLSNGQSLCHINGLPQTENVQDARLIILFDISASMGQYVEYFWQALKTVLANTNYSKIDIITFGERYHQYTTTPAQIEKWRCPSTEGSTQMSGATQAVFKILTKEQSSLFQFLIISDGELHDFDRTRPSMWVRPKNYVLDTVNKTAPQKFANHDIQVAGIRLGSDGSTRVMSCFFKYQNSGEPYLRDVSHTIEDVHMSILEIFNIFAKNQRSDFTTLKTAGAHSLTLHPMIRATQTLRVHNDSWFLVNTNDLMSLNLEATLNPQITITEKQALPFLKTLELQIKNYKIIGNESVLKDMATFMTALGSIIKNPPTDIENVSNVRGKIREIRRTASKAQKSIIIRIQELLNTENVSKLNAQQQADFLRQVDSGNRNARSLARRHGDSDIQEALLKNIRGGFTHTPDVDNRDEFISFMSLATTGEVMQDAIEEMSVIIPTGETTAEIMSPEQFLQAIGGIGICFSGPIGDFPDPWQYRVNAVYPGVRLGQHELWEAHSHNPDMINQHPTLRMEKNAQVTGVDVIAETPANQAYLASMRTLNRIHSSISMRRVMALIPNDDIALKAAVIVRQIIQAVHNPTELELHQLFVNIKTLRSMVRPRVRSVFGDEFTTFMENELTVDNPRFARFWSGDLDVSSILKPIVWMLISQDTTPYMTTERDMGDLELYHQVRGFIGRVENPQEARDNHIKYILNIKSAHMTRPQSPGDPEPDVLTFYDDFDETDIIARALEVFDVRKPLRMVRELFQVLKYSGASDFAVFESSIRNTHTVYDNDDVMLVFSLIQALSNGKMSDRIGQDHQLMTIVPTSCDVCISTIKDMIRSEYQTAYDHMLSTKIKREEEIHIELAVESLIYATNVDEFIEILNREIPDRSNPGYIELMGEMGSPNVPLRHEKLWILAFGRSLIFNPDVHDVKDPSWIVWNRGNILKKDEGDTYNHIITLGNEIGQLVLSLDGFKTSHRCMGYIPHVYRPSNNPNRHGHCNSHPYIPEEYRDMYEYKRA